MLNSIPSEMFGPAFLAIFLGIAVAIASKHERPPDPSQVLPAACLMLAMQSVHVAEEFTTGFHLRLPVLFGLEPWSDSFFVAFNLTWIALWGLALHQLARGKLGFPALAALWFLAIAGIGNAVWHTLLSLWTGGYFPGNISALPEGLGGALLARQLSGRRSAFPL